MCTLWKRRQERFVLTNILWQYCRDMFVGTYAQTISVQHFCGEQSGLMYYYSPVIGNVFGCADYSVEHFEAFSYKEGEGQRGGRSLVFADPSLVSEEICVTYGNRVKGRLC